MFLLIDIMLQIEKKLITIWIIVQLLFRRRRRLLRLFTLVELLLEAWKKELLRENKALTLFCIFFLNYILNNWTLTN